MKTFQFLGHSYLCENKKPHVPHQIGEYETVRYGTLQNFCVGRAPAQFHVEEEEAGDAETPAFFKGFSW